MKKVLAIGLLFVHIQSFGQSLHPNYKAQLNNNLEIKDIKQVKIKELPDLLSNKNSTPKYRIKVANISIMEEKANKHLNYKQHATSNSSKIK